MTTPKNKSDAAQALVAWTDINDLHSCAKSDQEAYDSEETHESAYSQMVKDGISTFH
jgi:hypothetical protein